MIERSHVVFAAHGLTLCEFFVLCAAGDRIPLRREPFIAAAKALSDGDPRGECSIEEFAAALDRLLARGWLVIVRPEDVAAEDERRARASVPDLLDSGYEA